MGQTLWRRSTATGAVGIQLQFETVKKNMTNNFFHKISQTFAKVPISVIVADEQILFFMFSTLFQLHCSGRFTIDCNHGLS